VIECVKNAFSLSNVKIAGLMYLPAKGVDPKISFEKMQLFYT
jgi:hypothetical protein